MNTDLVTKISADITIASGDHVDLDGAESCALILRTQNTTTVTLTEGDESDGSDATAVDDEFILVGDAVGTIAANVVSYTSAVTGIIGYVGKKRYLTVTVANAAVDTTIVLVKGDLHESPEA